MARQLSQEQRAHHPADPAGIGLMMLGEAFDPPAGEIRIGAE